MAKYNRLQLVDSDRKHAHPMERAKYFNYGTRPASMRTRSETERKQKRNKERERDTGLLSMDEERDEEK